MADINMDNVNIEIQSSSDKASSGVDKLIQTLSNLKSALSGVQNNINKYIQGIGKIGNVSKKIKAPKISSGTNKTQTQKETEFLNSNVPTKTPKTNGSKNNKDEIKGVELLQIRLKSLNGTISKTGQRIKNMFKYLGQSRLIRGVIKGLDTSFGGLGKNLDNARKRINYLIKNFSKYALALYGIRSAFYAVRNTTNEFLSSQNQVAQQLSANISYLKYAIGSSLAPVITFITNLIYSLLKAIQYLVYYFARINIFSKASAKNMASGAGSAGKTTKELQKQLQAFDELNNINLENNSGSGGGGGAGGIAPNLDLSEIDPKFKYLFDDIENWGRKLAEKINELLGKINWTPILDGAEKVSQKLAKILNDFTYYLDFGLLGETIAQGINTAITFVNTFYQNYKWDVLGTQLGNGLNSMIDTIQWNTLGELLTDKIRALILTVEGFVTTFNWNKLGESIGEMVTSAFNNIPWDNLANAINVGAVGFLDSFIAFLDTVDWEEIGRTIGKFLNDINWKDIFTKLFTAIGKIGKGLVQVMWNGIFSGNDTMVLAGVISGFAGLKLAIKGLSGIANLAVNFSKFGDAIGGVSKLLPLLKGGLIVIVGIIGSAITTITTFTTILKGVKLTFDSFFDILENGANRTNTSLAAIGAALTAISVVVGLIVAPIPTMFTSVIAIVIGVKKALFENRDAIKSVQKAQEDYNKAIKNSINAQEDYENAIDRASDTLANLQQIEKDTGLSGEALYNQVQNGTLAYENMTQVQRQVYKAYKDNKEAQDEATEATNALKEAKKEEIRQSFEHQLALAKESKNYDEFKKSVVDAFEKEEISAEEARDLIERSMSDMSDASEQTFMKDLPNDLKEGLNPDKYATGAQRVTEALNKKFNEFLTSFNIMKRWWDEKIAPWFTIEKWRDIAEKAKNGITTKFNELKNSFNPIRDWWNTKIAPWFTVAKWRELANKGVQGIKSAFSGLNIHIKMPHFSWSQQAVGGTVGNILRALSLPATLPKLNVSWYAGGGYPTEGDLFFANEAGPEMIGKIGNKTTVANNDQITRAIAEATYEAVSQALHENQDSSQPIIVNVGNETLYKGMTRSRSQASNQYGITV